jgi:adenylylsulfate kinase-like enzyme
MSPSTGIPVLWLCGPPGVGKSVVGWELYTRLTRIPGGATPAYVDVDQVGICSPPPEGDPARYLLKARNVGALRANFGAAGASGLVVSGVVDAQQGPEADLVGGGEITVCRLRVDPAELVTRIGGRAASTAQPDAAVREGDALDRSTFADMVVDTTGLPIGAAADRVLSQIGDWPGERHHRGRSHPLGLPGEGDILWLCGPTGVGKSTIGFRTYLAVAGSGIPTAYADVDQLAFHPAAQADHRLRARNLAALCAGFAANGPRALVVVGPVTSSSDMTIYEQALPTTRFTWCRLQASPDELTRRILSRRDGGSWAQPGDPLRAQPREHLLEVARRAITEPEILDQNALALRLDVDSLSPQEAARLLLTRTAWPPGG